MVPAEPALDGDNNVIEFRPNKNNSASFKLKQQIKKKQIENGGTKDVEIMVSVKYISNLKCLKLIVKLHLSGNVLKIVYQ